MRMLLRSMQVHMPLPEQQRSLFTPIDMTLEDTHTHSHGQSIQVLPFLGSQNAAQCCPNSRNHLQMQFVTQRHVRTAIPDTWQHMRKFVVATWYDCITGEKAVNAMINLSRVQWQRMHPHKRTHPCVHANTRHRNTHLAAQR